MNTLRGVIERITYHNEENGYTVAKLTPEGGQGPMGNSGSFTRAYEIPIIGNMAGVNVGESVELQGKWTLHAEYGRQFQVERMRTVLPATIAGIEKYLGSGLIKGVGPVTAQRIVRHFGLETLNVIETTPQRLAEVPGVGQKRVKMIIHAWSEQRAIKEVMIFLQGHEVSTGLATKIYKYYGDDAIDIVQQDPYRLARDIFGIGFLTADKIARSMGLAADSPQRVAAGVAYTLNQATDDGHVYLPTPVLIQRASELLEVTLQQTSVGVLRLWQDEQVQVVTAPGSDTMPVLEGQQADPYGIPQLLAEPGGLYSTATIEQSQQFLEHEHAVYLTPFFYSEKGAASQLRRLLQCPESSLPAFQSRLFDWAKTFVELEENSSLSLAPQQQEAIHATLNHRVTVLTGGPGTGKTTTVHSILKLCQKYRYKVLLAAPTGRAAKRLTETTGEEAKTLHRLLEFKPSEGMAFKRNEESPLEGDLLIVDEASMLDLILTNHLLKAVPSGMHLLLVGDVDQLPSVGAGNVLKDIIAALGDPSSDLLSDTPQSSPHQPKVIYQKSAAIIRLQTIFRQAAGSYIITNAHRINQGLIPIMDNESATDFFLFRTEEPERAAQLCVELVQSRIPQRFAIPSTDIQVLTPMHRGQLGVAALNQAVQQAINPLLPDKYQRPVGNRVYREGDRVMQIRNNYDKDVYNGDMGFITRLDPEAQHLIVDYDNRSIIYDFLELDELTHAYTISIHKSQGSEFPVVVVPVVTSHYMMLQRNLLYTAVTRARRLVVLVGQPRAIGIAVSNNKVSARFTGLQERLENYF